MFYIIITYIVVVSKEMNLEKISTYQNIEKTSQNKSNYVLSYLQSLDHINNSGPTSVVKIQNDAKSKKDCRHTKLGDTYTEFMKHTALGCTCEYWVYFKYNHIHQDFPDGSIMAAENYCRNPNKDNKGLWCYTSMNRKDYCYVPICRDVSSNSNNCRTSIQGSDYAGNISHTKQGYECRAWKDIQNHVRYDYEFPEKSIYAAKNLCRNPDNDEYGPWCYTMEGEVEWQQCLIPFCKGYCHYDKSPFCDDVKPKTRNCKRTVTGSDYAGSISHTEEGIHCQSWHKQTPNEHIKGSFDWEFPDADVYSAKNHCRNPDNDKRGPWCYTMQGNMKYCDIPMCDVKNRIRAAANKIFLGFSPVMMIFGTATNVLSIKVFLRPSLIELSTSFLMRVLAVVDMMVLNTKALDSLIYALPGLNIAGGSDLGCKLWNYFLSIVSSYSGWVINVITLERIVALALPLKTAEICTKKNGIICVSVTFVMICTLFVSVFFSVV